MDHSCFVFKDNIFNSEGKSLESDPVVRRLLKDTELSDTFKKWLRQLYSKNPVDASRVENMTLPQGVLPFNSLLKEMTDQYLRKYAIEIRICNTEEFEELISLSLVLEHPIGVIVTADHEIDPGFYYYKSFNSTMHVTPVLLNFRNEKKEAIILDSAGVNAEAVPVEPLSEFVDCTLKHLSRGQCMPYIASAARQADPFSCRTDALIILRNALLDLKKGFETLESKLIKITSDRLVSLPMQWSYTSQIFHKLHCGRSESCNLDVEMLSPSGQLITVCGRTLEEFWREYLMPATFKYELRLPESLCSIAEIPQLPKNYSVIVKDNRLYIQSLQTRKINDYLRLKGIEFSERFTQTT